MATAETLTRLRPRPETRTGLSPAGTLLRHWRSLRGLSQLDLSLAADVSARHVSFIETGRSQPSRAMLLTLASALDMPLRDQNALLSAAGFAPRFAETSLDDPAMAHMRDVLGFLLEQHAPNPALAMDRHWKILLANEPALTLTAALVAPESPALQEPLNAMRLVFHPEGMRRAMTNWKEVGPALLQRLKREALEAGGDDETTRLVEELEELGGLGPEAGVIDLRTMPPLMLATHFDLNGKRFSLFSAITTLGTPQDITLQEVRIETFFPADQASAEMLKTLNAQGPLSAKS